MSVAPDFDTEADEIAFNTAIAQFNEQQFYACHDTLEALWIEAMEPQRTFLQGVLQLAVGYYHLLNQNWRGATILLGEGLSRLDYYCPEYLSVDVAALVRTSRDNLAALQALKPEQVEQFPHDRIPTIRWHSAPSS
ncbi:MAG: DUF309 domain-containing protein [Cyanobacteria bacterium P01_F01_bin.33]